MGFRKFGKKSEAAPKEDAKRMDMDEGIVPSAPSEAEEVEDMEQPQPASDLIGPDSSALSLDGRSLIVPNDGGDEDMSSLGTSKYGGFNFSTGSAIGYIGNMKIVGRAEEYDNEGAPTPPYRSPNQSPYHHSSGAGDYDFQTTDYSVQTEEKEQARTYIEDKKEDEDAEKEHGCLPLWIATAPLWLKLVIIGSTALLLGAIVLIGVGASLAKDKSGSSSAQNPSLPATTAPVSAPTSPALTTSAPSASLQQTNAPTNAPTQPPSTISVTNTPVTGTFPPQNTELPTSTTGDQSVGPTVINFFAMGGRFDDDELPLLTENLQSLPNIDGNTILFHLGDWNSPYATSCVETSYTNNVDVYSQSSVPVYFVPGDNEFNGLLMTDSFLMLCSDCPDPDQAFGFWNEYVLGFESKYWLAPSWEISRQGPDHPENFSFLHGRVLFVGLNLVGGVVHDPQEWATRHEANLLWVNQTVSELDGSFDTMIIVSHADPDIDINDNFFVPFYEMVQTYDEKVIYMHRNLGIDSWQLEPQFNGIPNLDVVVVEGSLWPPMWIQLNTETGSFAMDQGSWYDEFSANGEMPSSP
ncbi:MAG: hypothetical protein SGILL_009047, partial [Bacillariaceae sp.]